MQRIDILQDLINSKKYKSYLEIGTYKGATILSLHCRNKIAIDPKIRISWKRKLKWILKNPTNINNQYFEMTSDEFFRSHKKTLNKMDLFFIDGLHTFEASLRDVLNSLNHLSDEGTVVMHDCYPPHAAAAVPAGSFAMAKELKPEGWNGQWCGDVWKTILYLKKKYPENLKVHVINTDFGLGVITKINNDINCNLDKELFNKIDELDYSYLINHNTEINLIDE